MEFFKTPQINFLGARKHFFLLSGILIVVSVVSLVIHRGPRFSIDFTGGTLVQAFFSEPVPLAQVRDVLTKAQMGTVELQSFPFHNAVIIRHKQTADKKDELATEITQALKNGFPDNSFKIERVDYVGPVVGRHLIKQASLAILFAMVGIVIYVAFRFEKFWGVAGVVALIHDVFLTIGFLSVTDKEISLTIVAALLTLAGYSINDSIVVFDRIRENLKARRKEPLENVVNRSLNETLSRTIMTSVTTLMVLVCLLVWGGEVLRDFSWALTFGIVVGSYSSLFISTPLLYAWQSRHLKR